MAEKKKGKAPPVEEHPKVPFDATQMVRLIAKDGSEYVLHRNCATVSKTIKTMLVTAAATLPQNTGALLLPLGGQSENVVNLPTVPSDLLEKAIQYFHYKYRYDNDPDNRPTFHVPPEMALDLMLVAHFLDT
jgi:transcription elongation factor B subunit 1